MSGDRNQHSAQILRSIIYISQQMDLTLVAEGVETLDRLQWLRESNCHFGQGYFWSPPASADATSELLSNISSGSSKKTRARSLAVTG